MGKYIVSARKYRPQRFQDVVGQGHVAKTITNAIENDQLAQAFLFCGPRGVGKTSCARILAKILNCSDKKEKAVPCEQCEACTSFTDNTSFNIIELDAASHNSVEHIRTLNEQVRFRPQQGEYKIFIIDEVHMLSASAFNAFLKTLEEPPPYAIFILATTEKHKIIPTILSRCQIFNFKRITVPDTVTALQEIAKKESVEIDDESLHLIAQKSDGALRDALSIFDKIASAAQGKVSYKETVENLNVLDHDHYFKFVDHFLKEDISAVLNAYNEILKSGFEPELLIQGLSDHFRNLMLAKNTSTLSILDASESLLERYKNQAELLDLDYVLNALNILNGADLTLPRSNQKNLHVEIALSKIVFQKHLKKKIVRRSSHNTGEAITAPSSAPQKTILKSPVKEIPKANAIPQVNTSIPKVSLSKEAAEKETIDLSKSATPSAPKITTNINSIISQIRQEEEDKKKATIEYNTENLQAIWDAHKEVHGSASVKNSLENTIFELKEKSLSVFVPTSVAKSMIQQEKELLNSLRTKFNIVDLEINIEADMSKFPNYKTIETKKLLSEQEVFTIMEEKNPKLRNLIDRFEMKPIK